MGAPKINPDQIASLQKIVKEVCQLVSNMSGIQLGDKQYPMVENRLKSRMLKLQITDPDLYLEYLRSHIEVESQNLLSLITTHHTYFFREFAHFEFLLKSGLQQSIAVAKQRGDKTIRVWSAACSRGQEVYSLAMFLDYHLSQVAPDITYQIWGTDVDPQSVKVASNGVYPFKELKQVPAHYLGNNWVRGTGEIADFAKIKKHLRDRCHFQTHNLASPGVAPGAGVKFDWIFCRNVYIYFDQAQIKKITQDLMSNLDSKGFLFIGVSETINGLGLNYESVGPSVYQHPRPADPSVVVKKVDSVPKEQIESFPEKLRVLCVDDSSSILTLLKKILGPGDGFEVVGTATNGREAMDFLKHNKVDVITLDIHMPEMDGISYLERNMSASHPPVVMLSSVNRENAGVAAKALKLGASDYVEKPSMANLLERGDEIRAKLKMAFLNRHLKVISELDQAFKRSFEIQSPETKMRLFLISIGEKRKISYILKNLSARDPGSIFVFEGTIECYESIFQALAKEAGKKAHFGWKEPLPGDIICVSLEQVASVLKTEVGKKRTSAFISGIPTKKVSDFILDLGSLHLALEDLGPYSKSQQKLLFDVATTRAPLTSYLSDSAEYFGSSKK
jgi:chemotaxis protein methyltransferase CheR